MRSLPTGSARPARAHGFPTRFICFRQRYTPNVRSYLEEYLQLNQGQIPEFNGELSACLHSQRVTVANMTMMMDGKPPS